MKWKTTFEFPERTAIYSAQLAQDMHARLLEKLDEFRWPQPVVIHVFVARPARPLGIAEAQEIDFRDGFVTIGEMVRKIENVQQYALRTKQAPRLDKHGQDFGAWHMLEHRIRALEIEGAVGKREVRRVSRSQVNYVGEFQERINVPSRRAQAVETVQ